MAEKLYSFEQIVQLMDQNINEVRFGVFSIAIVGLAASVRRVRPFSRFTRPSDIPKRFIRSRTKLNGTVERIEPNGVLLMVQHEPLFRILPTKVDSLPVKISGVSVNGNGISWLQTIVSGHNVTFIPVLKQSNCIECEVMLDLIKDKKVNTLHIGPNLVSIGFATVLPIQKSLESDGFHLAYYKTLTNAEIIAEKKRLGNWYYLNATQNISLKLARLLLTSTLALFRTRAKSAISTKSVDKAIEKSVKSVEKSAKSVEKPVKSEKKVAPA